MVSDLTVCWALWVVLLAASIAMLPAAALPCLLDANARATTFFDTADML
jgi:hypothetical protein